MKRFIIITLVVFSTSILVCADMNSGDQTIMGNAGVMIPVSQIDLTNLGGGKTDAGSVGFSGGAQYMYYVSPSLGLGADFNYSGTGTKDSTSVIPGFTTSTDVKSVIFLASLRTNLVTTGNFIPYLSIGAGLDSTQLNMGVRPPTGFVWSNTGTTETRSVINDTETSFAGMFGLGFDIYQSPQLFFGAEGRYQYFGKATYKSVPVLSGVGGFGGVDGSFGQFAILAHVGYKFDFMPQTTGRAAPPMAPATTSMAAPTPHPVLTDEQKAHNFIVSGYTGIVTDLKNGKGTYLSSLLDLLKVPPEGRADASKRIQALSVAYPNIVEFADRTVELYLSHPAPAAPTPVPVPEPETSAPAVSTAPAAPVACPYSVTSGQAVTIHLKSGKIKQGKLLSCDAQLRIQSGIFTYTFQFDEIDTVQ